MKHLSIAFITVSKMYTVLFIGAPPAQHVVGTAGEASHRRWWGSWPVAAFLHLLHRGRHWSLLRTISLRDNTADGCWGRGRMDRWSCIRSCGSSQRESDSPLL